ncbi:ATP-dependent nuclease [Pseudarthrobacter sp. So.54]
MTVLVGPNNQGKSNLLHGISLGMKVIDQLANGVNPPKTSPRRSPVPFFYPRRAELVNDFDWERDYPLNLTTRSYTSIRFEFRLDAKEVTDFQRIIGSRVNGTLPIEIKFYPNKPPSLSIPKPGKGSKSYAAKSPEIADFIKKRIKFIFVPAVRTVDQAMQVINQLASERMSSLEADLEYQSLLRKIEDKRSDHFRAIESSVSTRLGSYLPGFDAIEIVGEPVSDFAAVRDILIDDGARTSLLQKGDGVKSIVSLALMHDVAEHANKDRQVILAVEEPEAHLHSDAIHEIRKVLAQVASKQQVILTTHSPLLLNRSHVASNILVQGNRARPTKRLEELRDCLGVRPGDNLSSATVSILVEGQTDERFLRKILSEKSSRIEGALVDGSIKIRPSGGGSGLTAAAKHLLIEPTTMFALIDNDNDGKNTLKKLGDDTLVPVENVFLVSPGGLFNKELEDFYSEELHRKVLNQMFAADVSSFEPWDDEKKWSNQVKPFLRTIGKPDDTYTVDTVKIRLVEEIERVGTQGLNPKADPILDSLVARLEKVVI